MKSLVSRELIPAISARYNTRYIQTIAEKMERVAVIVEYTFRLRPLVAGAVDEEADEVAGDPALEEAAVVDSFATCVADARSDVAAPKPDVAAAASDDAADVAADTSDAAAEVADDTSDAAADVADDTSDAAADVAEEMIEDAEETIDDEALAVDEVLPALPSALCTNPTTESVVGVDQYSRWS